MERLKPHIGKSQKSLVSQLQLDSNNKALNEQIISRLLGLKGKISNTEEFLKANIKVKTMRLDKTGTRVAESMSFPSFKFIDIANQTWEESDFYNTLDSSKFLFIIFKFDSNDELYFYSVKFWNMPYSDILEAGRVWNAAKEAITNGLILTPSPKGLSSNLPKQSQSSVAHVRPHAKNAADTYPLPDGRNYTKQCFWLNQAYISEQILK